jgi:cell shape-determining protein MreC
MKTQEIGELNYKIRQLEEQCRKVSELEFRLKSVMSENVKLKFNDFG